MSEFEPRAQQVVKLFSKLVEQVNAAGCPECGCRLYTKYTRIDSPLVSHICNGCGKEWMPLVAGDVDALEKRIGKLVDVVNAATTASASQEKAADPMPEAELLSSAVKQFCEGLIEAGVKIKQHGDELAAASIPPQEEAKPDTSALMYELRRIREALAESLNATARIAEAMGKWDRDGFPPSDPLEETVPSPKPIKPKPTTEEAVPCTHSS